MTITTMTRGHVFALFHAPLVAVFALAVLTGCAVQLAPSYDKTIVDGLSAVNEKALIMFASVSSGVGKATFANREASYNEVIGKLDALRLQIIARPTPRPIIYRMLGIGPSSSANPAKKEIDVLSEAPSIHAIGEVIAVMTKMRDEDSKGGLRPVIVTGLKRSYEISMDQTLVYEKALER